MAKKIWYYEQNNEPVGPVSLRQLKKLVGADKVLSDTMIYKEGLADWQPASSFGELFYSSYSQVPFYSKQWFFWLIFLLLPCAALWPLMFGANVYYQRKGRVREFGTAGVVAAWIVFILSCCYWGVILKSPKGGIEYGSVVSPLLGEIPMVRHVVYRYFYADEIERQSKEIERRRQQEQNQFLNDLGERREQSQ